MKLRRRLALLIDPSLRRDLESRYVRAGDVIPVNKATTNTTTEAVRVIRVEYADVLRGFEP